MVTSHPLCPAYNLSNMLCPGLFRSYKSLGHEYLKYECQGLMNIMLVAAGLHSRVLSLGGQQWGAPTHHDLMQQTTSGSHLVDLPSSFPRVALTCPYLASTEMLEGVSPPHPILKNVISIALSVPRCSPTSEWEISLPSILFFSRTSLPTKLPGPPPLWV